MMKAAVIGNPIKHSRSPLIHNHWLKKLGIDGSYEAIHAENETDFIRTVKQLKENCLLYTSPSPRDVEESRMPSSA